MAPTALLLLAVMEAPMATSTAGAAVPSPTTAITTTTTQTTMMVPLATLMTSFVKLNFVLYLFIFTTT